MNPLENKRPTRKWVILLLRFIIYITVGFLSAFLYRQIKN